MDRRRFLLGLVGALAAATTLTAATSEVAEALPLQPPPELPPEPTPEHAIATEADLEAAKAQEAYWVRRRRWRRYYWRPRRRYWRRYYWRPRRRYWRRRYRRVYFY